MMLSINNPVQSTVIFTILFLCALFFSYRKTGEKGLSISRTQELKGFAIFAVVFSHIGYFLVKEHAFLFPLSIMAGVGVNLFLFLSGFGLTISSLKKEESVLQFYKRRLLKLLVPFWVVLILFLLLDFFILHITYSKEFIVQSFLGIFPHADIFSNLNSPFWYMTLIIFYYLLYPIFFSKRHTWITVIMLYLSTYLIIKSNPLFVKDVIGLYKVHLVAFPLGVYVASCTSKKIYKDMYISIRNIFDNLSVQIKKILYYSSLVFLLGLICYFSIHSGIGENIKIEQTTSIITMISLILLFCIKKNEYKLLTLFGVYSYEIYLIHWPIMYRYNIFYGHIYSWLATILYLALFLLLAYILKIYVEKIYRIFTK